MQKFNNQEQKFKIDKKNMISKDELKSEKLCSFDGYEHDATPKLSNKQN